MKRIAWWVCLALVLLAPAPEAFARVPAPADVIRPAPEAEAKDAGPQAARQDMPATGQPGLKNPRATRFKTPEAPIDLSGSAGRDSAPEPPRDQAR